MRSSMIRIVSWITFTAADVKARLSARELAAYEETAAEGDEEAIDRMQVVVDQVLASFRGSIRANPNVTAMGEAGTLPDFCILHAAVLARHGLIGLNPVPEGMTDPRRDEVREANTFLKDLRTMSSQAFGEDPPTTTASSSASYGGAALLDF
jgi:hypothetical protein